MSQADLINTLYTWYFNFTTNVSNSVSNLTLTDYIRLTWIIGGYLFLRPYLDKGFAKLMKSGTAKSEADGAEGSATTGSKISANTLRGVKDDNEGELQDEESEEGEATGVNWGKSARRKQKKFMDYLEQEAERKKAEDDDKDIADLLED